MTTTRVARSAHTIHTPNAMENSPTGTSNPPATITADGSDEDIELIDQDDIAALQAGDRRTGEPIAPPLDLTDPRNGERLMNAPFENDAEVPVPDPDAPRIQRPLLTLEQAAREGGVNREELGDLKSTRAQLHATEKIMVTIYQAPLNEKQLPDVTITINGYDTVIKRGVMVEVPMQVAEQLVQSGLIYPPTAELRKFAPRMDPLVAARLRPVGSG